MRYALLVFAVVFVLLAGIFPCAAQSAKGQYKGIVVTVFDAQKGIDFPPDFQEALFKGLVTQLDKLKKFSTVLKQGDPGTEGAAGSLKRLYSRMCG
jgi:hypothetical protein